MNPQNQHNQGNTNSAPSTGASQTGQVIPQTLQAQIPPPNQVHAESQNVAYGADASERAKHVSAATSALPPETIDAINNRASAQPETTTTTTPAAPAPQTTQAANRYAATLPPNQDTSISTQTTLLISELRDSVVIMKDGSFRAVVACQSINFDLMSTTERDAIEYSYQNFLNSINFTIQILVRSQKIDISPYIDRLTRIRHNTDNMLLGILMDDYIDFINALAQEANIMDKSFFVVIPYYSSVEQEKEVTETKNFFTTFTRSSRVTEVTRINRATYDKALDELHKRVDAVVSGLYQIGIKSVRLDTRGLSALYYNFNNPDTALREPLVDFNQMATTFVQRAPDSANPPAGGNNV